jgi:hypothetical protein
MFTGLDLDGRGLVSMNVDGFVYRAWEMRLKMLKKSKGSKNEPE